MTASNNHPESPAPPPAADVRALLADMKDKRPEEVLGIGAHGGLVRAAAQATLGAVVLLVVCSAGPLVWRKVAPAPQRPAAKAPADPEDAGKGEPARAAPATKETPPAAAAAVEPKQPPVGKDAVEKLGLNEAKPANPKVNPLDSATDDLLKDLDKK
jgi:hypothetical protein